MRNKTAQWANLCKHSNLKQISSQRFKKQFSPLLILWNSGIIWLVERFITHLIDLSYNSIEDLSLEWPEHNGLVLDRVHHKPLPWLDQTSTYAVYCSHCYHKTIPENRTASIVSTFISLWRSQCESCLDSWVLCSVKVCTVNNLKPWILVQFLKYTFINNCTFHLNLMFTFINLCSPQNIAFYKLGTLSFSRYLTFKTQTRLFLYLLSRTRAFDFSI